MKESGRTARKMLRAVMLFLLVLAVLGLAWSVNAQETGFSVAVLTTSTPGIGASIDSRLRDPWGMAVMWSGPWWIVNNENGRLTSYGGGGVPTPSFDPLSVAFPAGPGDGFDHATPSGIAFNPGGGFDLGPSEPAWFVIATREGQVEGWFPGSGDHEASILLDRGPDAGYSGDAIAGGRLYLANFRQGRIDVFDGSLTSLDLGEAAFTAPDLPEGLSPYNVQMMRGSVYVAFAAPDDEGRFAVADSGQVSVFDGEGHFQYTLQPGPWMNAPWGMALSPAGFGAYGNAVLIAETGSGRIAAFNPESGGFLGYLRDQQGAVIAIPGLHDIAFGNDGRAGSSDALYYTAGSGGAGSFGAIYPAL